MYKTKTEIIHPKNNIRYDTEFNLEEEVSPYEDMPDDQRKTQRSWHKGEYKQY